MPRFMLGITIMFWGWQTGLWFFALPMALVYEASYFLRWRWTLSTKEFMEIGKLAGLLLVGVLLYIITANRSVYWIFEFFTWLPVIFFPFLAGQAYAVSDRIDIRMFFYFLRKHQPIAVNLTYPFFALCLISASAGNLRGIAFYLGMFLLCTAALWLRRSSRFSPLVWISLMLLAGSIGFLGHLALYRLHRVVQHKTMEFLSELYHHHHHYDDPTERTTAIGDIGSVKLTNKILFRVQPEPEELPTLLRESLLLRRVSYNKYQAGTWVGVNSEFTPIPSTSGTTNWALATKTDDISKTSQDIATVTISTNLPQGHSFLNLPQGTRQISQLPGDAMEKNQYGTVKVEVQPGLVSYQVQYSQDFALDSKPTKEDLQIPPQEKAAIDTIVAQLNLQDKSPAEILQKVTNFFNTEFTYSLDLAPPENNRTVLAAFLLDHRYGHCEYFATATALLLRDLGIPTRYVIGYSVHEYSPWENQFIVRSRNSHAWTLVYLNDAWREFDTTPSSWIAMEDANSSQLVFLQDLFSWASFKLAVLISQIKSGEAAYLYWLLMFPLGFILLRQFKIRQGIKRIDRLKDRTEDLRWGIDSEIYLIETALKESEIIRHPNETWHDWLIQLEQDNQISPDLINDLQVIVQLHYRYRFDPLGINEFERNQLQSMTQSWLTRYTKPNISLK
ncbi:transglutaminase family protein [Xenococcus sp. PCC 7305]|uniref:transglutaminase-like domain-containing protein n=1 Tax=Xenococcus sp. PCC 7305 TaxID=102125 RepID=UPI001EE6FD45|nr:transglutaminase domain-containing protein [Xenococcus sp. PCC 7305]